jgi:hypothetical protein
VQIVVAVCKCCATCHVLNYVLSVAQISCQCLVFLLVTSVCVVVCVCVCLCAPTKRVSYFLTLIERTAHHIGVPEIVMIFTYHDNFSSSHDKVYNSTVVTGK